MEHSSITYKKIAEWLNVSHSTVSKALRSSIFTIKNMGIGKIPIPIFFIVFQI
ncbi:MAG: hypothetical protein IJ303_03945 [Clostridia bacterium]|nr:hypothetical protein [Clostridia bacterium]